MLRGLNAAQLIGEDLNPLEKAMKVNHDHLTKDLRDDLVYLR